MLIGGTLCLLSSNAVVIRRDKSISYARSTLVILMVMIIIAVNSVNYLLEESSLGILNGLFSISTNNQIFHIFMFIICFLILKLNSFFPRKVYSSNCSSIFKLLLYKLDYLKSYIVNKKSGQFNILEYPLIIMFVVIGGTLLVSSSDFISVFLSIELQSYGLYILSTIYKDSEKATSAGLTYFLLGGLSSCFILLCSGIIYANSGNTGFDSMYVINSVSMVGNHVYEIWEGIYLNSYTSYYISFSLTILSIGFLFKITAAPFHSWSPDVYDAIPTIVTTFVTIFAKISIFVILLELVNYTTNLSVLEPNTENSNLLFSYSWTFTFLLSSLLSLTIGSLAGLTQLRIKRLYAYSTISHIGFILLALAINSVESIQSFIFYLLQYSLVNLNAFLILITVGFSLYLFTEKEKKNISSTFLKITDKYNSPLQLISQIKGYFHINPILAVSLAITIFSFVGIPPLIGFFAKQMVLSSAINNGYIFITFVAILTSVISAYYYLALIKQTFFYDPDYIFNPELKSISLKIDMVNTYTNNVMEQLTLNEESVTLSSSLTVVISMLTIMISLFVFTPQEWLSTSNILALTIFNH